MESQVVSSQKIPDLQQKVREREYWLEKLSGEPEKSCFPYDHRVGRDRRPVLEVESFGITGDLFQRILQVSNRSDLRLFIILLSGVTALLKRYSGRGDVILGSPIERQDVAEDYINTVLILRARVEEQDTFKELLLRVSRTVAEANEHVNYPLESLLYQLKLPHSEFDFPLFDVGVILDNLQDRKDIASLPLNVFFSFRKSEEEIVGSLEYNPDRYNPETAQQIVSHLNRLLSGTLDNLDLPLGTIDMLGDNEREMLLVKFNDNATDYPGDTSLHSLFKIEAETGPDRIALVDYENRITYRELDARSDRLAAWLRSRGVQPGHIIGLMLDPSPEMLTAVFGILKAGGAYLPVDPDFPAERIITMLEDCDSPLMLIRSHLGPETAILREKFRGEICRLDKIPAGGDIAVPEAQINDSSQLAYIMFTSGSSGKPKGTLTTHRNVVRIVKDTNYINIGPDDSLLQLSNFAFDGSVFGIFGALLNGASLSIPTREDAFSVDILAELIIRHNITIFFLTTALFNTLVDTRLDSLKRVRRILFGGERVSVEHVERALKKLGPGRIIHMYGPTETTVYATYHVVNEIDKNLGTIPIGKPVANTSIYILDGDLKPVPVGVVGEIFIGGPGLARGYLKRENLTAEKFIENPFLEGDLIYRSGDLARWLQGGDIEFVGRKDQQIKLRGFRIEPGEIEAALLVHQAIHKALVLLRENSAGEKFLCAYVETGDPEAEGVQAAELKTFLGGRLPDYMIPHFFVMLDALPLNPNGKVDTKALPTLESTRLAAEGTVIRPRSELEERLLEIWSRVLSIAADKISIEADFFELGGHSLKATTVIADIHRELDVKIPLEEIFQEPTVRGLAEYIRGAARDRFLSIPIVEKREYYPLSYAQKSMYYLQQMEPDSTQYNSPQVIYLKQAADPQKLEETFLQLIERHESLRTSVYVIDDQPVQVVHDSVDFAVEFFDTGDSGGNRKEKIRNLIDSFERPFDLGIPPFLRARLIDTGREEQVLLVDMHHIISDERSLEIVQEEFYRLYAGESLSRIQLQYRDFALWQNGHEQLRVAKKQEHYWLKQFQGKLPRLTLPVDVPLASFQGFEGDNYEFQASPEETARLREFVKVHNASMAILMLAVYNIFLARLTGQEEIIVGVPASGRRHADLHNIVGRFVNMLAMRNFPHLDRPFEDFFHEVKSSFLRAFENQDYQVEELINRLGLKREGNQNPLYNTIFAFLGSGTHDGESGEAIPDEYLLAHKTSKSPVDFYAYESKANLHMGFKYLTGFFKGETVEKMSRFVNNIVHAVSQDPTIRLGEIELLSELDKSQVFKEKRKLIGLPDDQYPNDAHPQGNRIDASFDL